MSEQPARERPVQGVGNATKTTRRREKTSAVWSYFKETDANNVKCNKCDHKTSATPTTNMWRHLKDSHNQVDIACYLLLFCLIS